ncbi:uncharacterized protein BDR25DRAFT_372913 [Lindgomyces ingoldianus]|uniref:Uncharacterized protein n=1 Tax=Lindgomyces ingoldianus TaxID=673940 RepID=A0ACB6QN26_9PLEO|nr:uncharacterized protein BDR25DRAFT_372913 [Lindgomyces ingoldianus]KAF2468424.1 hypothetical protein BDR25DRAFT_372913 [Lindgomyces ingoldianus]
MGFVALPALIPDIAAVYDVYFEAFRYTSILSALFSLATASDLTSSGSEFRKAHIAHTLSYCETGSVMGMTLWDVYVHPNNWKKEGVAWLEEKEKVRAERLPSPLWEARERCHLITVYPSYQKRGVGTKLTEGGIQIVQETGLPIYLESSKEGIHMCEKLGFQIEDCEVSLMVWVPEGKGSALLD